MSHLLHLDSSARTASFSRRISARIADGWRSAHPTGRYTYRDLSRDPVPFITEGWTQICDTLLAEQITDPTRYADAVRTPQQRDAWEVAAPLLDELLAADVVLLGVPMYNYSVPAALKAWMDQVTFPRMDLSPRRFVVATARGGSYGAGAPNAPFDYQGRFLSDYVAGHFGVADVRFVHAELVNAGIDPLLRELAPQHEDSVRAALVEADRITESWIGSEGLAS